MSIGIHDELRLREAGKILATHPLVDQAIVLAQGDEMAEQVVGYVIGDIDDAANGKIALLLSGDGTGCYPGNLRQDRPDAAGG